MTEYKECQSTSWSRSPATTSVGERGHWGCGGDKTAVALVKSVSGKGMDVSKGIINKPCFIKVPRVKASHRNLLLLWYESILVRTGQHVCPYSTATAASWFRADALIWNIFLVSNITAQKKSSQQPCKILLACYRAALQADGLGALLPRVTDHTSPWAVFIFRWLATNFLSQQEKFVFLKI